MITGLAGLKAVHSTSVRRWRESLCRVLQLLGLVASRGEGRRLDMHHMITELQLRRLPSSLLVQEVVARIG